MTVNIRSTWSRVSAQATLLVACSLVAAHTSLVGLAQAQSAGEMKPLAVVALSGYDALVEDLNFAGSLAGNPQMGGMLEGMIMMSTQGKGLVGFDKTNPIGVVIQTDGADFAGAACLPVTDLQNLLALLQPPPFSMNAEDAGGGVTKLSGPGQTVFIREANGWAFVSPMQPMLDALPEDPAKSLTSITQEYDFGARVNVQNVPEQYRQQAIDALETGMKAGLQPMPNESEEQFAARKEMTAAQLEQLKQMINDLDEVTIGLALDGPEQRAYLDFVYTAVPGTKLAKQLAMYDESRTNFAGFFQPDAAMMMSFASKMTEADIAQVDQMFGAIRKQVKTAVEQEAELPNEEARQAMQSAMDDLLDACQATLQAGMMDGGAVLNLAPNSVTFVAGCFIGEPAKVESGLKKIEEVIKQEEDFPGVQWNADSHRDVSFHTLTLPIPEHEEEPRQMFGETIELAVGIGKESVYFALGRDCLEKAKSVIDASLAKPQKSVPPMEMTVSLKQIMQMVAAYADEDDKQVAETITNMLDNEAVGRDHVRIVMQTIPNGIRTRIEAEEGVLRAIGMAAMQAQMQAAGAGQGF